ncbi:hypothetical protein VNO80_26980 [Phaseolus coccineus]|uniref:Uncharacterized protein n=1 Tax=Phaseolus coccineus TaxID=3886 RepID=A0AAN9LFZ9_PHACN
MQGSVAWPPHLNGVPQPLLNLCTSRISSFRVGPLKCGNSSNGYNGNECRGLQEWIDQVGEALSTAFPLWVTIGCVLGLFRPSYVSWVSPKLNIFGLTIIMLGMGMTPTLDDLRGALSMPKEVLSGFVLQYSALLLILLHILLGILALRTAVPINAFNGFDELGNLITYLFC